ncbi:hypothetical protein MNBD_CHLOROFLEXI01-3559, partial [hydrothermal vent metagenome]
MDFLIVANVLFAQGTEPVGVPGWIPIAIGAILLLLFWWGLTRNSIPQGHVEQDAHHDMAETAVPVLTKAVTPPAAPDDLKKIEGIGPKI